MNKNDLFSAIGNIDDTIVSQSTVPVKIKRFTARKITAVAAAMAVFVCAVTVFITDRSSVIKTVEGDATITVQKISNESSVSSKSFSLAYDLVDLSLEEIFEQYCSAVFRGTVIDAQNVKITANYGGKTYTDYNAIATVKVEKVFKGDIKAGDTVSILLNCPVDVDGYWVEDTDVVCNMRKGTSGIFMPRLNGSESYSEENGVRLMYKDVAEYSFSDGVRFAFLEGDNGLIYDEWTYGKSLSKAKTLDDVENFVINNLS